MKLTNLEPARDWDVKEWLEKELKLTPYQKEILRREGFIYDSPFYFYKPRKKEEVHFLWRFTILVFPVYLLFMLIGLPFMKIFTGKFYYSRKVFDFHSKWVKKLDL